MSFFGSLGGIVKKALPIASTVAGFIPGVGLPIKAGLTVASMLANRGGGAPGVATGSAGPALDAAGRAAQGWAQQAGDQQAAGRNTFLALLNGQGAPGAVNTQAADASRAQFMGQLAHSPLEGPDAATGLLASGPRSTSPYSADAAASRAQFQQLAQGGQDALTTSFGSTMRAAMPGFLNSVQGARAGAIRRGVTTGDLGTSYEGDVTSAFQRNSANALAGQATALYGQQLGAAQQLAGMDQSAREDDLNRAAGTYGQQLGAATTLRGQTADVYGRQLTAAGQLYGQDADRESAAAGRDLSAYTARLGAANDLYRTDAGSTESARNTWLDLLSGNADRQTAAANAASQRTSNLWGSVIGAGGAILGGMAGSGSLAHAGNSILGALRGGSAAGLLPAGGPAGVTLTPSATPPYRPAPATLRMPTVARPSRYGVRKDF